MTTMFTPDHEWINIEDHEAAIVGITLHAQDALGDVVFVDLPAVGTHASRRARWPASSSRSRPRPTSTCRSSGEVVEVNEALRADPSLANSDPMGNGWFFKVHVDAHGRVRPADGPAGLRRAAEDRSDPHRPCSIARNSPPC